MLLNAVLLVLVFLQIAFAWTDLRADSLLLTVARAKNIRMIGLALIQGADVQTLDDNGVGAAEWASREGHISLSEALHASGAK